MLPPEIEKMFDDCKTVEECYIGLGADEEFMKEYYRMERGLFLHHLWRLVTLRSGILNFFKVWVFKVNNFEIARKLHISKKTVDFLEEYII